jgi:hypothetical protein
MIQDILTQGIVAFSVLLVLRSIVRFFTLKLSAKKNSIALGHDCGSCGSTCSLKGVMNTIEQNAVDVGNVNAHSH